MACSSDSPLEFLEDTPEIRSHPDDPVSVPAVDHLLDEIIRERHVWVPMRDGTRLSANVFRPAGEEAVPVTMALTAYDKNKGLDLYPKLLRNALDPDFDLGRFSVSPWAAWEGPDPAYWVPYGTLTRVDSRFLKANLERPTQCHFISLR